MSGRALLRAARRSADERASHCSELSASLAKEYSADAVVLTDRGTSALQLAFHVARLHTDGPVALPAYTCYEVASAAVGANARIRLYDVDPETLSPDLVSLEHALLGGARAVVVSPLFGVPVEWDSIDGLLARYGGIAIEDAAQGHGGSWRGKALGSHAPLSVLSFGRGKGWTGGGGGALLARGSLAAAASQVGSSIPPSHDGYKRAIVSASQWALGRPSLFALPAAIPWLQLGQTVYHDPSAPRAMDPFSCALALTTRTLAEHEAVVRRQHARELAARLASLAAWRQVHVPTHGEAGYLRFPVRLTVGGEAFSTRFRALGVAPGYPTSLFELSAVQERLVGGVQRFPGAEALARELVTLPTHSLLTAPDLDNLEHACAGVVNADVNTSGARVESLSAH